MFDRDGNDDQKRKLGPRSEDPSADIIESLEEALFDVLDSMGGTQKFIGSAHGLSLPPERCDQIDILMEVVEPRVRARRK